VVYASEDWFFGARGTLLIPKESCGAAPCVVDEVFLPVRVGFHWSSSTLKDTPASAWAVSFGDVDPFAGGKTSELAVRAVRGGS